MKHLPLRECVCAIIAVVVLLGLYGGAYLAMMQRTEFGWFSGLTYRFGGEHARWFFAPAHDLDRRLRPDLWRDEIRVGDFDPTVRTTTYKLVGVMGTPVEEAP